jgi:hypothetical protein
LLSVYSKRKDFRLPLDNHLSNVQELS